MTHWTRPPLPQGFEGFAPPTGSGSLGVLVCAEALGEMEARYSVPLYQGAPAGGMFERLLGRIGISRDQLTLTNVCWSRPPRNYYENAPWEAEATEAYRPLLDQLIAERKPKVIVALGNVALRRLTAYGGDKTGVTAMRGAVLASDYGWVVPTYHPSFLVQGQHKLSGVFCHDFNRALSVAKKGLTRDTSQRYLLYPTLQDAELYFKDYNPDKDVLSYDIETPESANLDEEEREDSDPSYTIIRVSFSYRAGTAITAPWSEPFINVVKRVLASGGPKRTFNGRSFDNPRLRANGCVIGGREYDLMFLWHHLQPSLPRGLQFVTSFYWDDFLPWKHTSSSEPELYSAIDANATQRCGDGIERDLRAQGMWARAESHVVNVLNGLDKISANGMPVDDERRKAFGLELESRYREREATLQTVISDDIKRQVCVLQPKNGYVREPKDTSGLTRMTFTAIERVDGEMRETRVERWVQVHPFNPNSPPQVKAYAKLHGHPLPTHRKTKKETSDDDALKRLVKKGTRKDGSIKDEYVVYQLVLECRKLTKVIGTYVEGWKPAKDGRVHPTGGIWGAMHRISWRRPNASATIADKDEEAIASGFRKCVRAEPGHLLLEADWKGIEAVLVGYFSGDKNYQRLASLGVHSYMAAHFMKCPVDTSLPDDELRRIFKQIKHDHPKVYDDAKHTEHGTNYGMTWKLLSELYNIPAAEAKRLIALKWALFPGVRQWQLRTVAQAATGKLSTPFRDIMWFWDIRRKQLGDGQWTWEGEDVKSAISFLPRDTAAAMLKEVLLRLRDLIDEGIVINCTHDSILAHPRIDDVDAVAARLKREMEAPVPELGGLSVGVDLKVGESWHADAMSAYELPIAKEA